MCTLGSQSVRPSLVLPPEALDREPQLLAEGAADEAANRVGLPVGGGHDLLEGRARRSAEQLEDRRLLATVARCGRFLLDLRGLLGLVPLGRDTSRLWRRLGAQALDRLPDPRHSAAAVGELLHRLQVVEGRDPGEAVPCVGQGAQGPSGGEVGQWKRLVKLLLRLRVLTDADGMVLANLCQAWSTLVKAQVKMNETGLLLKTPSG